MTEVLIVGAGTVGLSAAVFLAHHGVRVHVVERADGPQQHPRATGVGVRTVELLREVGLAEAVNAVAVDMSAGTLGKIGAETLAAADLPHRPAGPHHARRTADTPYTPAVLRGTCPQNRLDAVLLPAARERGAIVEYGVALEDFEQDATGVRARLCDGRLLRADYLVAADGVRSPIRAALGIGTTGAGNLGTAKNNTLFRADLSGLLGPHSFIACDLTHPRVRGTLMTIDGAHEWVLHTEQSLEVTPELIRTALGAPGLPVEIVSTLPWRIRALLADRYSRGRVFLVGDAAHAIPPLGAFGMNTGIADAHNLAWKLALVLRGTATPALLATYHQERHPVGRLAVEQATLRLADPELHWGRGPAASAARAAAGVLNAPIVQLGYRYASAAVIDPDPTLPSTEDVEHVLDGSAGSRLPHRWIAGGLSTLDLVRSRFTLLTGPDGAHWRPAAARLDLPVHTVELARIPAGGALLVRPDGFVAWRAAATPQDLGAVLARLLDPPVDPAYDRADDRAAAAGSAA
ncbi:FAD-dependent monooxygenase [Kitasatospora nipponensis]|uniref:FAD-dependent monooxygenase n=1 Tax=Kitasatospora nipponensis TaxID=258049 RepID=A0ABP4HKD7_9ACTN